MQRFFFVHTSQISDHPKMKLVTTSKFTKIFAKNCQFEFAINLRPFHLVSFLFREIKDIPVKIINLGCGVGEYSQQRQQGRQEGRERGAKEGPQPHSDAPGRACAL
jgi:hypothetical protein